MKNWVSIIYYIYMMKYSAVKFLIRKYLQDNVNELSILSVYTHTHMHAHTNIYTGKTAISLSIKSIVCFWMVGFQVTFIFMLFCVFQISSWPQGMQDLHSPVGMESLAPAMEAWFLIIGLPGKFWFDFFKKLNIFDVWHCVSLRCTACYFDPFIYCHMIADIVVFITLPNYSAVLLSVFIILCVRSQQLIHYSMQICTLKHHHSYPSPKPPTPAALAPGTRDFSLFFLQV